MRTASEIADMLDRLQQYHTAISTSLLFLNDLDVLRLVEAKGLDKGSTVRLGRYDGSYYEGIDVWGAIHSVRGDTGFNLDFLGLVTMTTLSWVGDELSRNRYFDRTPELEFFRHLRNAVSHGNTFNLANGEPRRPAKFGTFEITPTLHGRPVLFEFIANGDLFDLFDHIKAHLRTLP